MRRILLSAALTCATILPTSAARGDEFASECGAVGETAIVYDAVSCQRIASPAVGGVTAFSYFAPARCIGKTCPVLFVMHGTGGDYTTQLGAIDGTPGQH